MAIKAYTHTQDIASNLWSVIHNLNTNAPIVSVNIDNGGTLEKIIPKDIRVTGSNTVEVEFTSPWTGIVRVV